MNDMAQVRRTPSQPLCWTFQTLADNVWQDLRDSYVAGLVRDEETITNDLMLAIWRHHPYDVIVYQFTKKEEAKTGADWEWWFTDNDHWFGMRVQAKIVDIKSKSYKTIRHTVGDPPRPQIDILVHEARRKHMYPVYLFYNYWPDWPRGIPCDCGQYFSKPTVASCCVADARAVRAALRTRGVSAQKLWKIFFVWSCLVCCSSDTGSNKPLPIRAREIASFMASVGRAHSEGSDDDLDWSVPQPSREPPSYIRRLLDTPADQRRTIMEEIRREIGPVDGLMVVRELPEGYEG